MRAPSVVTVAVLALAGLSAAAPARAQYAPPGMTFGPPAAPDPVTVATAAAGPAIAAAPAPYTPPHMTFGPVPQAPPSGVAVAEESAPSPWEWAFGAGAGPGRKGPWGGEGGRGPALVIELSLVRRVGASFVAGGMLSLPSGALAVAGWRLGLSPALRLDLLADAGLVALTAGTGEAEVAPAVGARAGLSWLSTRRHRYLMLSVAARGAWGRVETWCDFATQECFRDRRGGTFLGAVLTYGSVGAVPGPADGRLEGGR
jgi:hypothetical protein